MWKATCERLVLFYPLILPFNFMPSVFQQSRFSIFKIDFISWHHENRRICYLLSIRQCLEFFVRFFYFNHYWMFFHLHFLEVVAEAPRRHRYRIPGSWETQFGFSSFSRGILLGSSLHYRGSLAFIITDIGACTFIEMPDLVRFEYMNPCHMSQVWTAHLFQIWWDNEENTGICK